MNLFAVAVLSMIVLTSSTAFAMGRPPGGYAEVSVEGKAAYDVTLPTVSGEKKSLSQAREGKKAILLFWATWCPHCHDEILAINKNLDALTAQGTKVILISLGEPRADVADYLKKNNITLDSFLDEDAVLQDPYGLIGVPTLIEVDEGGIIRKVSHSLIK